MSQTEKRKATLNLNSLYVSNKHPQYDATVKHIKETLQAVINTEPTYADSTFTTLESKLSQNGEPSINFSTVSGGVCLLDYLVSKHFGETPTTEDVPFVYEYRIGGGVSPSISVYCERRVTGVVSPDMIVTVVSCNYKDLVVPVVGNCEETSASIDGNSYCFTTRSLTVEEFKTEWDV